jgi:hypothetical protein
MSPPRQRRSCVCGPEVTWLGAAHRPPAHSHRAAASTDLKGFGRTQNERSEPVWDGSLQMVSGMVTLGGALTDSIGQLRDGIQIRPLIRKVRTWRNEYVVKLDL